LQLASAQDDAILANVLPEEIARYQSGHPYQKEPK
jgi:hypothetical protein